MFAFHAPNLVNPHPQLANGLRHWLKLCRKIFEASIWKCLTCTKYRRYRTVCTKYKDTSFLNFIHPTVASWNCGKRWRPTKSRHSEAVGSFAFSRGQTKLDAWESDLFVVRCQFARTKSWLFSTVIWLLGKELGKEPAKELKRLKS